MMEKLVVVAALLTGVLGTAVSPASRQGNLNSYYLYTRAHDDARTHLELPEHEDRLNSTLDTVVIVHGHGGDAFQGLNPWLKNEFFNNDVRADKELDVIVVDWSSYTKQSYSVASAAVPSVGRALGEYLRQLATGTTEIVEGEPVDVPAKISLERLHLIGFNLGAHVVGFAGRNLNGDVARITGLDPSGSNWGSNSPRLSKADARYVEVIHTDGDGRLANGIGTPLGHVDFFVNGGSSQPGCFSHSCCHDRAWQVFAASLVRSEPLEGRLCSNNLQLSLNRCQGLTVPLGGDAFWKRHDNNNSVFRVNTGRNYPY